MSAMVDLPKMLAVRERRADQDRRNGFRDYLRGLKSSKTSGKSAPK